MERISILLDEPELFDQQLKNSLKEGCDIMIVTKDKATESSLPAVLISFSVQLPDGSIRRAQCVTTVRLFQQAAAAMRGRYGDL